MIEEVNVRKKAVAEVRLLKRLGGTLGFLDESSQCSMTHCETPKDSLDEALLNMEAEPAKNPQHNW
jgi:hypothetical protein